MPCTVCTKPITEADEAIELGAGRGNAHTKCLGCAICRQSLDCPASEIQQLPNTGDYAHLNPVLCIASLGQAVYELQLPTQSQGVKFLITQREKLKKGAG